MTINFVLFLFLIIEAQSQQCVVQNLPGFANQGGSSVERIEGGSTGTQAIIPDYSFDCYGNVTQWGAFVEYPGFRERYTLDFQVWRRSGGGMEPTGNYDFVGNNHFSSISPAQGSGGQILTDVPVEQQIQVRPGDVIGFYVHDERNRNDNGVELHTNSRDVTVWFITTTAAVSTRIEVGNTDLIGLYSSTTGAPVITAVVVPSPSLIPLPSTSSSSQTPVPLTPFPSQTPSSSPTPAPSLFSSPVLPTASVLTTTSTAPLLPLMITLTQTQAPVQFSAPSTPQTSSFLPPPDTTLSPVGSGLPVSSGLPVGAIVAIVIVVLIVIVLGILILVFILTLVRRRRSKKTPDNSEHSGSTAASVAKLEHFEMNANDAYITNTAEITTTGNVAYMTAGDAIPATQNVAYGQVPPGTDECYDYVICD